MSSLTEDVQATVKLAMSMLDETNDFARSQFSSRPVKRQPIEDARFLEQMLAQYPPEPWISPGGVMVNASPWLLALREAQGGKKELQRIERTYGQGGY